MIFSLGDKVKVSNPKGKAGYIWADREGEIIEVADTNYPYPYEVQFGPGNTLCFSAEELSPIAEAPESDPVNHPSHYTWLPNGIEVIDITKHFSFTLGNALKYIMRAGHKGNTLEDLKKAVWYLEHEIKAMEAAA
ncbi:DUF3310 domain-containing protein [Streptomyces sp. NPDC047990]|uniref:DUF3310 domain-containing protein n=1 Tax=Streptomyces sp. NPDC047990 TaxID=3365496 RepID=UPI0037236147